MSKGGGGGGGTQTVTQKTELPGWVTDAAIKNLNQSYNVSQAMPGPYDGPRYAGMTDAMKADIAGLQMAVGQTQPGYALAQSGAANIMNYSPGMVQSGGYDAAMVGGVPQTEADQIRAAYLANTNLQPYMNPYTQSVVDYGLKALESQRLQALNGIGDQAVRSNAFGGSRQGVLEGVTNAGAAMQAGTLASNLMNQNFMQAQNAAVGDINRNFAMQQANQNANLNASGMNMSALMQAALANQAASNQAAQYNLGTNLQAQLANQAAGLQGAGLNLTAANALGQLTGQGQGAYLDALRAAIAGQGMYQQDQQGLYDAMQAAYRENQNFPLTQLQIPLMALGMTPYGQTQTTTGPAQPQQSSSGFMQGLGGLASLIGMGGTLFGSGGIFPGALAGLSDENEKTDVKKVGKDPDTGLNLYAYRYKDDPKTYPKVVGPMAQEIAEKYPDQVHDVGGRLAVNLGFGPMRRAFN